MSIAKAKSKANAKYQRDIDEEIEFSQALLAFKRKQRRELLAFIKKHKKRSKLDDELERVRRVRSTPFSYNRA